MEEVIIKIFRKLESKGGYYKPPERPQLAKGIEWDTRYSYWVRKEDYELVKNKGIIWDDAIGYVIPFGKWYELTEAAEEGSEDAREFINWVYKMLKDAIIATFKFVYEDINQITPDLVNITYEKKFGGYIFDMKKLQMIKEKIKEIEVIEKEEAREQFIKNLKSIIQKKFLKVVSNYDGTILWIATDSGNYVVNFRENIFHPITEVRDITPEETEKYGYKNISVEKAKEIIENHLKKEASMNNIIITNAFSLAMIDKFPVIIKVKEIPEEEVKSYSLKSAVGHPSTAELLTARLGQPIEFNRETIKLKEGDKIIVAQLMGERKEYKEMTKEEVEKYPIKYLLVEIIHQEKSLEIE